MKVLKPVLLFFWGLLALAAGGVLLCCVVNSSVRGAWQERIADLFVSDQFWVFGLIAGVLAVALAGLSLFLSVYARKTMSYAEVAMKDEYGNANGSIKVSLAAIDSVVKKVALQISGIKDVKTVIRSETAGVTVMLDVVLFPDCVIPETLALLQREVKAQLEFLVGLQVYQVKMAVANIAGPR
ncbi:MAG: alkaline shock response membrane anchor protein AmaP [Clostridiales bacterium]|nr:alkaline shock response membrane anchor protein AmaP [Clostridiales bacterium]